MLLSLLLSHSVLVLSHAEEGERCVGRVRWNKRRTSSITPPLASVEMEKQRWKETKKLFFSLTATIMWMLKQSPSFLDEAKLSFAKVQLLSEWPDWICSCFYLWNYYINSVWNCLSSLDTDTESFFFSSPTFGCPASRAWSAATPSRPWRRPGWSSTGPPSPSSGRPRSGSGGRSSPSSPSSTSLTGLTSLGRVWEKNIGELVLQFCFVPLKGLKIVQKKKKKIFHFSTLVAPSLLTCWNCHWFPAFLHSLSRRDF